MLRSCHCTAKHKRWQVTRVQGLEALLCQYGWARSITRQGSSRRRVAKQLFQYRRDRSAVMPIAVSIGQPTWRPRLATASNSPAPVKATPVPAAAQSLAVAGSRTSCTKIRDRTIQAMLVKCQAKRRTRRARSLARTPSLRASSGPINFHSPNTECAKAVTTSNAAAVESKPSDMVKPKSPYIDFNNGNGSALILLTHHLTLPVKPCFGMATPEGVEPPTLRSEV